MKDFKFENYTSDKGKFVMWCKTEDEAIEFCKLMHKDGKRWSVGGSYLRDNCWNYYRNDTVYYFNEGMFHYVRGARDEGCTILEWSDSEHDSIKEFRFEDYTKYRGDYIMHCETKQDAKEFCALMHKHGKEWGNCKSCLKEDYWEIFKENTCYNFNSKSARYGDVRLLRRYTILKWSDFRKEGNYE